MTEFNLDAWLNGAVSAVKTLKSEFEKRRSNYKRLLIRHLGIDDPTCTAMLDAKDGQYWIVWFGWKTEDGKRVPGTERKEVSAELAEKMKQLGF